MASRERVVEFAVKARDEYSKVLKNIETQQNKLSAASQAANRRAVVGVAEGDLQSAVENFKRLTSEVARYQTALDGGRKSGSLAANEMKELAETIALTRNRSREAIESVNQHRAALNKMQGGAVTGYAAFDRLADSMQKEAAASDVAKTAALAAAVADERAAKAAALKAQIQERLNTVTESGFGNWQRYIDTVNRVRAADEKANAVAVLKAQIQARLNNPVASGYAAFIRAAEGANAEAAAVSTVTTQLNKLTAATNTAAKAQGVLAKSSAAARGSTALSGVKGEAQNVTAFGLKPYQLTNLGYQVNDVISGLASGQKPLQILAQQAGQFIQIWPGVMSALARSIPIFGGVALVIAPFVAAVLRMKSAADSLEIFNKELSLSADGSRYSAQELVKITDQMDAFGISTSKARTLVKQFISDGVDQKNFAPLAQMAQRLSDITGDSVVDAGKQLSTAFSGGVDSVRDLDKELNFLTAAQYAQIEAMAKAGNTAGALALSQDILAAKLASSAGQTSAWANAATSAGKAWNGLLDIIEKSGLLGIISKELDKTGKDFENAANDLVRNVNQVKGAISRLNGGVDVSNLEAVRAKLAEINGHLAEQKALLEAGQTVYADMGALEAQRAMLAEIVQQRQDELQAIKDGAAAQASSTALSEADKKARLDIQAVIDKQGKLLTDETRQAQLTNRERYIEGELLKAKNSALEEAKRLNQDILGLTADQTNQIRAQAGMAYDSSHPNYEAQYVAQRNSGSASSQQMAEIVKFASIIADQLKIDVKDVLTAISYETKGTFNPAIVGGAGNNYEGLFQAGPGARARYGIGKDSSIQAQLEAMAKYLTDAGVKAGDGLLQIYAAINAGNAKNINASDEKNGGAPGTVLDKVSDQMGDHQAKAEGILAAYKGISEQAKATSEFEKGFTERRDAAAAELDYKTRETRQAAINKALVDETNKAKKAGVELTQQQIDLVKQQAGAEFDRAHADDEVNKLVAQRTALFQSLQIAQAAGDQDKVGSTIEQIGLVEEKLKEAIPAAIAFWQAIGGSGADQEIAKLQAIQEGIGQTLQKLDKQFLPQAQQINEELADIGGNAFSAFAQALATGENAAQAFFNSLLQGIADFLIEIGKAIVKQALFNALSGGAGAGGSGGIGGSIGGWIASLFHEGGIVGSPSASGARAFNPAVFANAEYHHSGGIVGLKSNEVPIIGLKGEEMLTEDDPRHVKNGGRGQASNTKIVNVFDVVDVLEAALADVAGQRVIMNYMTRNSQKLSQALTGG
ncbi:phage tail length tape measure family protein [Mesorhizobium sp. M0292]|uniref:phage tail length tape measure family protein n=1 Tax=Mesorhizobium sp. M0292 TaxID=2956929 RepID=UPI00333AA118